MPQTNVSGRFGYGGRVGYLENLVENYIRERAGLPLAPEPAHHRIISVKEAQARTGMSRVQLWRLEADGRFPKRIQLTNLDNANPDMTLPRRGDRRADDAAA
jgi:hypothetical protein